MNPTTLLSTLAMLALCGALPPMNARAASTVPANPSGERYLFVVDKSSDMERLQDATEATIFDLIGSGLYGQMQAGDTFGLWTFNKEVITGKFSMQVWDPRRARQQATVVAAFLSGVNYEGASNTKDVTEKLKSVVHAVSNVTAFVISDGDATMKGTPFDKTINAEYKRQRRQRASAKRPFVTTLIARDGWIIDHSVTIAGTRIDLPPRPSPPEPATPALVNEPKTNAAVSPPVAQAPAPAAPKPAPKVTIITRRPVETNAPAGPPATAPAPALAVTPSAPVPAPAPTSIPAPKTYEVTSQENILAAASLVKAGGTTAESPSAPSPANVTPGASTTSPAVSGASTRPAHPAATAIPVPSAAVETVLARLTPDPVPVAARETHPAATTAGTSPDTGTLQGVGTPVPQSGSPVLLIAFGALMLVAALTLGFTVLRQRRPATSASLITRSMERR